MSPPANDVRQLYPVEPLTPGPDVSELISLAELKRRHILQVLSAVGGNRTRACQILKVDRKTLYVRLKNYQRRAHQTEARNAPRVPT